MSRIKDKKEDVENFISELEEIMPSSYKEYIGKIEKRLSCERAFEKIIESINDLAILIIKEKRLPFPQDDEKAFEILSKQGLIKETLAVNLREAKGMRNFLAHQYDKIDDELVFEAITNKIINDANEFLKSFNEIK